ncbi:hypothetical protein Tco_0885821 [Tanacetum coccineum]
MALMGIHEDSELEKFFYPANHVREEEPKQARENNDAPIIEDWVSDDEEELGYPKVEKKTSIPTATKKESVKPEKPIRRSIRGLLSNVSAGIQGVSESSTSSQQDQDCIVMPIWKDASYFDDASLKSVDDAQIQDQDGTHDDCSLQNNGTADQQVNTASPEVNTGSREVSTVVPEINTATP